MQDTKEHHNQEMHHDEKSHDVHKAEEHHKSHHDHHHLKVALLVIAAAIFVFSAAFFTENKGATGLVVSDDNVELPKATSILLNNANSMSQLSPGNYYIDQKANVQWMDDSSRPVVAKLQSYNENELDRSVYVSIEGQVFFVR